MNTEPYIITKAEYQKIFGDDVTVKEQKVLIAKVADRVDWIIRQIARVKWWDFVEEDFFQSFDRIDEYVAIDGEYSFNVTYFEHVYNWFAVEWLFSDCIESIRQEEQKHLEEEKLLKEKQNQKRSELKIKKESMKKQIMDKLTKEELKFVKFK